ncbi:MULTISPECIES: fimbria/pilus outer membrane usher protein [unclassified Pseudomonas]|uniref:fimbria/pilus outer membrane usher protein n=1 Tax=unclassified Pseudomonas TaxID=196821 RepID=UPI0002A27416|nr:MULTISPECIES: fimbria/pilus outer membrane usher protein [unclassified Pseudomonas]NTX89118.1 fimbrial biogenesis outer membrane usher protein [Pseudomonas sp. UMA643]NTY22372.1 fimbrial biogenesis outer membrane usher protein [Pseudomonas sp. UMC3103]NTY24964.1 fimbrial biogenesis outer membrane usher protein [Pseudomonas sp. UMA603]NTY34648.1 fimbrial biogenesis outer membrane usher protein [Pseudomonas sp. UMC3129]NTY55919.1 fimbrial biogenesis outer membrane usher protein [Pseudomonas s
MGSCTGFIRRWSGRRGTTVALGSLAAALAGLPSLVGWADDQPVRFDTDFLRNAPGQTVDLTRFEQGSPVQPGSYTLDLYLNDNWQGRQRVEVREDASVCWAREQLPLLGLAIDRLPAEAREALQAADPACIDLQRLIPDSRVAPDLADMRLELSIPQAYLRRTRADHVDPRDWDRGITAAFVDYNANAYRSDVGGSSSSQYYAGLNSGVNLGDWRLRHNGSYSRSDGVSEYDAISSYAQRDITALKSQLTLGEYYTPADLFDSVPFTGVQLASDERMLPDSQRGFAPAIRGTAETNAKVTVRQGGNILYETTVAPGPFIIDELYGTGYAGDLEVTVTEADGRERRFTVPFASVAQLLRPGVSRYSLSAGEYRDERLDDAPKFLQGTYQRGLSNLWTGYTGGIVAQNYLALQGGVALSTPVGAFAFDVTRSSASGLDPVHGLGGEASGESYRLSYSKLVESTRTNFAVAAYRFSSEGYLGLGEFAELSDGSGGTGRFRQRNRLQANISQPLADGWGSFYLSGSAQNYWNVDAGSDLSYQAGYSNGWRWGSLNLSASRTRSQSGQSQNQYMLSLSLPLGRAPSSPYLSSSYSRTDNGASDAQLGLSGSLGERSAFSYGVYASRSRNDGGSSTSSGANAQYRASAASLSASVSDGDGYRQLGVGLSGSLLAHAGGINFSPDQGETKVLVEARGASGAGLVNSTGAQVAGNGFAFTSGLTPYRRNRVGLDPKGLGEDVELQLTEQTVAPRFGSVALLKYPTRNGQPLLLTLRDEDGGKLPVGAEVLDAEGTSLTLVGQGSRVFLRAEQAQGELLVRWGTSPDRQCAAAYQLPEAKAEGQPFFRLEALCRRSAN